MPQKVRYLPCLMSNALCCHALQCTPPGLIYARAGEMRANNKVLVLQVITFNLYI